MPQFRGLCCHSARQHSQVIGRLLPYDQAVVKVGHSYRVALPVAVYRTWRDTNLEGRGVTPDVAAPLDASALRAGEDTQLEAARNAVTDAGV